MSKPDSRSNRQGRYWDRLAKRYAKSPIADQAAYEKKLEVTRRHFPPAARVLEFGCGTGTTAILHAPYAGEIWATDLSGRMIEIARARAEADGVTNVRFEQADIDTLSAARDSFDVVMGMSILHLVPDRDRVVKKAFGLVKPGGVFVSSTICMTDAFGWFRYAGPIGKAIGLFPDVQMFTKVELIDSICAAGFEIDHEWQPGPKAAVFIVARRPAV